MRNNKNVPPIPKNNSQKSKNKKPFYKKWWFILLVVFFILGSFGNSEDETETQKEEPIVKEEANVNEEKEEPIEEVLEPEDKIKKIITDRADEKYSATSIDSISVNENLGTEAPDDYIVIVNMSYKLKNKGATAKDVINMYSSDLAATIAEKSPNVQEIAIMWKAPIFENGETNTAHAKCSYSRHEDGKMYEMDMFWDELFN